MVEKRIADTGVGGPIKNPEVSRMMQEFAGPTGRTERKPGQSMNEVAEEVMARIDGRSRRFQAGRIDRTPGNIPGNQGK